MLWFSRKPNLSRDQIQVLRHQFLEASRQLKEQMREAFDKDDRYCATGDEKYYLDLPGKENEKVVARHSCLSVQSISLSSSSSSLEFSASLSELCLAGFDE